MAYNAGEARLAVVPDPSGFKAKTEAALRGIQVDFAVQVGADTSRAAQELAVFRAREAANAVNLRVDVDTAGAAAQIAALRSGSAASSFGPGALQINAGLLGLSALGPAALGITQLAGAIQQLSQAAFVLPGAIGGAVASIGTLAIGVSGVGSAYEAITKAAEDSGQSQAASARQAAAAQNAHRNAAVDNAQAHKDLARAYRDARQEITDLNIEVNGGVISEKQAINDALRARRDLASGQFKDALDFADAQLRVEAADQRVVEARQRNIDLQERVTEANAKGISGSDQVVAAQERVVRSEQALAEAQANTAAAASAGSAAQQKAAAEMAKLTPNAREFVEALIDTKTARDEIRASAQEPLFEGLAAELRELTERALPSVNTGVRDIAVALNQNIRQLMQSMGSDNSRGLLDRLLGNTADAQARFTAAIDPLVRGVGTLVAAGSDSLPRIADAIGAVSERFATFIETADKDGRLARWIDEGLDGFTNLGNILINLGKSFTAITGAVGGPGLLSTLNDLTNRMATFLNSAEGQQELRAFFQQARQDLENWKPILESLPGLFRGLMDAGREWAAIILPPLGQISSFLSEHPDLIQAVVVAFAAWKTISGVASLITNLRTISSLLGSGGGRGGRGGKGILGKIALLTGGALLLDGLLDEEGDPSAPPPSAGESAGDLAGNVAGGALAGYGVAGPPGAAVGAVGGVGKSIYDRVTGDFERGKAEADAAAEASRERHRNDTTGPYAPPPGGALATDELRAKIAAGQLPGYTLAPDGVTIIGPDGAPLPAFDSGGPTPSGRGPGPTGGWLAEIHDDEWILPKHARRAVGDRALWALTQGRSFQPGGYIDQYGNPITPGAAPGPAPGAPNVAPNPYQGGGIPGVLGSFMSGIQGPISNALSVGQSLAGMAPGTSPGLGASPTSVADRLATMPGLAGLIGSATGSNPAAGMAAWGQQTASWLGGWLSNTLSGFGSALWQGALGVVGLENSILSPGNSWNQSGQQIGQFFLGQDGPAAALTGGAGPSGAAPGVGQQMITLGDGSQIAIPTFGSTAAGAMTNPAIAQLDQFAQSQAVGQKYLYGGVGVSTKEGVPGGYDCSGIASAIYAKAAGLPQGTRYFTTESDFEALGFKPGSMPGALNIGVMRGGGGPNSHMALTLPNGVNVESGGAHGTTAYGGPAKGASDFPLRWYLPMPAGAGKGAVPGVYRTGGAVFGPGGPTSDLIPSWLSNDEHVFTAADVKAMGGQREVYAFRKKLHGYAFGGQPTVDRNSLLAAYAVKPPPRPGGFQEVPNARTKQLPAPTPRGVAPSMDPQPVPAAPQPIPQTAQPEAPTTAGGAPQIAPAAPGGTNHTLSAIDTAIASGAATLGNIAATAASMGAGAAGAGPLSGMAGSLVGGLFQQGGKIAQGYANVVSSLLVGSVPGSFGGPVGSNPYGTPVRAEQNAPVTAPGRVQNNTFHGMDIPTVFQQLDIREAQASQAELAKY